MAIKNWKSLSSIAKKNVQERYAEKGKRVTSSGKIVDADEPDKIVSFAGVRSEDVKQAIIQRMTDKGEIIVKGAGKRTQQDIIASQQGNVGVMRGPSYGTDIYVSKGASDRIQQMQPQGMSQREASPRRSAKITTVVEARNAFNRMLSEEASRRGLQSIDSLVKAQQERGKAKWFGETSWQQEAAGGIVGQLITRQFKTKNPFASGTKLSLTPNVLFEKSKVSKSKLMQATYGYAGKGVELITYAGEKPISTALTIYAFGKAPTFLGKGFESILPRVITNPKLLSLTGQIGQKAISSAVPAYFTYSGIKTYSKMKTQGLTTSGALGASSVDLSLGLTFRTYGKYQKIKSLKKSTPTGLYEFGKKPEFKLFTSPKTRFKESTELKQLSEPEITQTGNVITQFITKKKYSDILLGESPSIKVSGTAAQQAYGALFRQRADIDVYTTFPGLRASQLGTQLSKLKIPGLEVKTSITSPGSIMEAGEVSFIKGGISTHPVSFHTKAFRRDFPMLFRGEETTAVKGEKLISLREQYYRKLSGYYTAGRQKDLPDLKNIIQVVSGASGTKKISVPKSKSLKDLPKSDYYYTGKTDYYSVTTKPSYYSASVKQTYKKTRTQPEYKKMPYTLLVNLPKYYPVAKTEVYQKPTKQRKYYPVTGRYLYNIPSTKWYGQGYKYTPSKSYKSQYPSKYNWKYTPSRKMELRQYLNIKKTKSKGFDMIYPEFTPKSRYQPSIVGAYLKLKTPELKKEKWLTGFEIRGF